MWVEQFAIGRVGRKSIETFASYLDGRDSSTGRQGRWSSRNWAWTRPAAPHRAISGCATAIPEREGH
jgi:hypothetical protein